MEDQVIHIDASQLPLIREEAGKLVFEQSAETAIGKLWELEEALSEAWAYVKSKIEETGLAFSEDFKSVEGATVKANYSASGTKYAIKEGQDLSLVPAELIEVVEIPASKKYKLKGAVDVDRWIKQNDGEMPTGVIELPRQKTVSLKKKVAK